MTVVGKTAGLDPGLMAALECASSKTGLTINVISGYRSHAEQQALYDARATNPYPVARPGVSKHEFHIAADLPLTQVPAVAAVAPSCGLAHPYPGTDPVHFELAGGASQAAIPAGAVATLVSNPLTGIADTAAALVKAGAWLANPHNWIRVLEVLGGGIGLIVGLLLVSKDLRHIVTDAAMAA